jgi:hypothetical protein
MADGSEPPAELTIDSETGVFELMKESTNKAVYQVEIDIVTTDGINEDALTVSGVTIEIVCGPESTILTAPDLESLIGASVSTDPLIIEGSSFTLSNELCPVVSYELNSESDFILTEQLPMFSVELDSKVEMQH